MTWEFYQSLGPGCGDKKIKLADAQRQVEFLERERQRWMKNARYLNNSNQKMQIRLADLEVELRRFVSKDGREGAVEER